MGLFGFKKKKSKSKEKKKEAAADTVAGTNNRKKEIQQQDGGSSNGGNNKVRASHSSSSGQHSSDQFNQQQQQQPQQQQQQQQQQQTIVEEMPAGDPAFAKAEVTRELVKKFISDIWNRGELNLIPKVCSEKIRFNGNTGLDKIGHDGFARMVATIHEALGDYHCEIHSMVVENNKAFCRLRFSGKHQGELLGYPPTGGMVSWMGATEFTCLNGRILKVWELGDMKTLEEQLQVHMMKINGGVNGGGGEGN